VRATFVQLHAKRGEFFERGVLAVFRGLSWDYKTNRPQAFGRRIVVKHVLDAWGSPDQHATDRLDDLERAMHLLGGRPEPDHRVSVNSRLWDERRKHGACAPWSGELTDEYLRIRLWKNGNAHIAFLRQDLVDEMNRILAKHFPNALPASRD
jgi:hypothetical protein